jgi:hypothetical protein
VSASSKWNDRLDAYGDGNVDVARWTGGDAANTTVLPDGRRLWLFSDSFLGVAGGGVAAIDGGRPLDAPVVSNALLVEDAGETVRATLVGGSDASPRAYLDAGETVPKSWFWPGSAVVEGKKVRVLANKFHRTGPGAFDFAFDGTAVLTLRLPALTAVTDPATVPVRNLGGVQWEHVLEQPDADYVYGTKHRNLYVARAPAGRLGGRWTYRRADGGWSPDPRRAAPVIRDGAGLDTQVVQVNNSFVRLSVRNSPGAFHNVILAYFACAPAGPWTQRGVPIYTAPEGDGDGTIVYSSYIHAETVHSGRMLANYSVNRPAGLDHASLRDYRPRFLHITMSGVP